MFAADVDRTSSTRGVDEADSGGITTQGKGDYGSGGLCTGSTLPAAVAKGSHRLAEEVRLLFAASSSSTRTAATATATGDSLPSPPPLPLSLK